MMSRKELMRFKALALRFMQEKKAEGNTRAADSVRYLIMEINTLLEYDIYDGVGDRCYYPD